MTNKFSALRQIAMAGFIGCLAFFDSGIVPSALAQGSATAGEELYTQFGCYQCHGHYGQGASTGPKLAPKPHPYEAFKVFVRNPVMRMPPYTENVLGDEQLREIHRYLESIQTGPGADKIPLLRQ